MLRYKTKTRPGLVALYDIRPGNGAGPQVEEIVCVFFSFVHFMLLCVSPRLYTIYVFHTPMAQQSPFVLKVQLNINQPNQTFCALLKQNFLQA